MTQYELYKGKNNLWHYGRKPKVGLVVEGTLRLEDLIQAFSTELETLTTSHAVSGVKSAARRAVGPSSIEFKQGVIEDLVEALNSYSPDGIWFGVSEQGQDQFGWWEK